jgi:2-amino-4-hydroxy-6-hydroxymethyldihydropteridine diphosphokinase
MDDHQVCLNIGSNIQPEQNLPKALALLAQTGQIEAVSTAWETKAVGTSGPNFLNACAFLSTRLEINAYKELAIQSIERTLGRVRYPDKYAPRTIDLDILMWDGEIFRLEQWNFAYIVIPMAELTPEFEHPITHEKLSRVAARIHAESWALPHPEIFKSIKPSHQA